MVLVHSKEVNKSLFVCPPIFDGDYWVNEFQRLHRQIAQRVGPNAYENKQDTSITDVSINVRRARDLLKELMSPQQSCYFLQPVDPVTLKIPTYCDIIKHPMDLGTVKTQLREHKYPTLLEMARVSCYLP